MATDVRDVPERDRYEVTVDGDLAGFAEYRLVDGARVFTHTEVFDAFEGQGVGSALARGALGHVRASGRRLARTRATEVTPMPIDPPRAQLVRAVPVLASLDIEATQRFYANKLGFVAVARYDDYGIVERDGVQIHFWLTDDVDIPKATSCRVDVDGVDQLHEEMNASGVVHPNGPLTDQPWGLREFAVLDGDGNMITFGQRMRREQRRTRG